MSQCPKKDWMSLSKISTAKIQVAPPCAPIPLSSRSVSSSIVLRLHFSFSGGLGKKRGPGDEARLVGDLAKSQAN